MRYTLIFTDAYNRRAAKWLKKHPDMRQQYLKTLQLLALNPHHPSLRLHALSGRLTGIHSVSINVAYRMTLHFWVDEHAIVPLDVGSHDTVY
ncbi:plasmid stabilization protein [Sinimarinibacterium sp. NLF-5-8]|uniref:type II toxin-antitoxin system RelE/ParE family toxin n=1 Tax=Sinimarinibacterium sp. NLF-5-8 TaxID=2698684 RepID=UPI00137BF21C|nr:plasmid stabilization protein [Sinimarinibacterium sp. NLF-5-8]QHS09202.1 plasmid stabilization protein [Sinimarinibacterium sp. NLF-5-8]